MTAPDDAPRAPDADVMTAEECLAIYADKSRYAGGSATGLLAVAREAARRATLAAEARAVVAVETAVAFVRDAALERVATLAQELKQALAAEAAAKATVRLATSSRDDVWFWQQSGNEPSSLSCPVVMSADTLREMLAWGAALGPTPTGPEAAPTEMRTCVWSNSIARADALYDGEPLPDLACCFTIATHTTCNPKGGVVCEQHKCRCSKPLAKEASSDV